jgi:hypothetical protein
MKRERRKPTREEWQRITSARPVVCRVLERKEKPKPAKGHKE